MAVGNAEDWSLSNLTLWSLVGYILSLIRVDFAFE